MSGAGIYALGAINLLVGLYSLASSLRYLRYLRRSMTRESMPPSRFPSLALLVPCCGKEEGLEDNLRALFRQNYPHYSIIFIVEEKADDSLAVIRELMSTEARHAHVVIAGPAESQGQKIHNLLAGLERTAGAEVLAFADSDGCPDSDWLEGLVAALEKPEVGVATGYRFYFPEPTSFASILRSVWNAGVLTLLGEHDHNFAWGGSMAIRREVFKEAGIEKAWQGALSDDYALTHAVRRAGYRVEFVPRCIVSSRGRVSLGEVSSWCARQMSITHVYWPNLWRIGGGSQVLFSAFLIVAAAAAWAGDALAALLLLAVLVLSALSGGLRTRALYLLGSDWKDRLGRHAWAYVLLAPLASLLSASSFLRSAFSRRITWRGKTYEMRSPTETVILR